MSIVFSDRFRYTLIVSFYKERIFLKHSLIRFSAVVLTIAFATVFVFSDESLVIEIDYEEPADLNDGRLARCASEDI